MSTGEPQDFLVRGQVVSDRPQTLDCTVDNRIASVAVHLIYAALPFFTNVCLVLLEGNND